MNGLPSTWTIGHAGRFEIGADELPGLPFEDFDHAATRSHPVACLPVAARFCLDGYCVARGRIERVFGGDEDVFHFGRESLCRVPPSSGLSGEGLTKPKPFCVRWKMPTIRGLTYSDRLRLRGTGNSEGSSATGGRTGLCTGSGGVRLTLVRTR